jgi:proteasome accessory factor B
VDRLRSARRLEEAFAPPAGFDLAKHERRAMDFDKDVAYEAKVHIRGDQERWLREKTPEDRLEELPEGGEVVTIPAKSLTWLVNEVLQYGPSAEVLEPPELRAELRRHLVAMRGAI